MLIVKSILVGWLSGLKRTIGNRVWSKDYPGFESRSHRMHYIYLLLLSNGDIYKGQTDDLRIRIDEHNKGKVHSTKSFRPIKLIGYEAYYLKTDAIRREKFLKTTEGKRLTKQQYRDVLAEKGSWGHPTPRHVE